MASKKVHIVLDFENSKGGGTSFLSFLRSEFIKKGIYTDKWYLADSILINSHHIQKFKLILIKNFPFRKIKIVHRVDGPMRIYNHSHDVRDDKVVWMNKYADTTVFQSEWSYKEHEKLYGKILSHVQVIPNVANPNYFKFKKRSYKGGIFKIISTVWSQNPNKGYKTYEWLDKNLDFNRFSLELVGAPNKTFKNIRNLNYLQPSDLAQKLEDAHAFLFPSRYEACSNALLEALATGLPCITYKGSSNVEIVRDSRLWFSEEEEIVCILNGLVTNYSDYMPQAFNGVDDTIREYKLVLIS